MTKLLKQVPWVNGFEQMDDDNEVWVSVDERANESNFRYDYGLKDDEFAEALEGDVLKSGGLYLGEDINVRFPRARKTVKLLKNAAIENNAKYAGMPLL